MIDTAELARRADIMALHSRRIRLWMISEEELKQMRTLCQHERAHKAIDKELKSRQQEHRS